MFPYSAGFQVYYKIYIQRNIRKKKHLKIYFHCLAAQPPANEKLCYKYL